MARTVTAPAANGAHNTPPIQAPPAATTDRLLALLDGVVRQDLIELEMEIEAQEGRLKSLQTVRRLMQQRLGVADPRAAHKKLPKRADAEPPARETTTRRRAAAVFLEKNGPASSSEIMRAIGCPQGSITFTLAHAWFEKLPTGNYTLTPLGRQESGAGD